MSPPDSNTCTNPGAAREEDLLSVTLTGGSTVGDRRFEEINPEKEKDGLELGVFVEESLSISDGI